MCKLVVLVAVAALVQFTTARLAPHFLSVGSGIGMPSAVRDKYHSTDSIIRTIADLEKNCRYIVRHEVQAFDPSTNGLRSNNAYTLTDPDTPKESKKRFMLTFGMHGREYISSEAALYLSQYVCQKSSGKAATTNTLVTKAVAKVNSEASNAALIPDALKPKLEDKPAPAVPAVTSSAPSAPSSIQANLELDSASNDAISRDRLMTILKNTEIVFIPIVNIDGRRKVETGASCTEQRKNGRSVDINRNFADWFNPNNAAPSEEDYQGPSAMSEWESNIIKTLAEQFHPHAYIDVHSGDLGMGYVFGHSGSDRSPHDSVNKQWASGINNEIFGGQVWVGNLANMGSMPYESHGSSCDYMYQTHHARIAGTWEIWRKPSYFGSSSKNDAAGAVSLAATTTSGNNVESKFDHVTSSTFKIESVADSASLTKQAIAGSPVALQTSLAAEMPEIHALLQTSLGKEVSEGLGLTELDIVTLVQEMKTQGKTHDEIQVLLQEMSREQCFAYFNPVLPDHYDQTVSSFARAILVGAEKLSHTEIAAGIA